MAYNIVYNIIEDVQNSGHFLKKKLMMRNGENNSLHSDPNFSLLCPTVHLFAHCYAIYAF